MENWAQFLITFVPVLVLLIFWVYFVRKMNSPRQSDLIERSFQHMERVEVLLERIAMVVEGRSSPDADRSSS